MGTFSDCQLVWTPPDPQGGAFGWDIHGSQESTKSRISWVFLAQGTECLQGIWGIYPSETPAHYPLIAAIPELIPTHFS